ncbi:MAG: hypothetical protein ACE15B_10375 [Bryobacteraceae bacterium]
MQAERAQIPRFAFLLAGVAAGTAVRLLVSGPRETASLRRQVADLRAEIARREAERDRRFESIENRLAEHDAALATVPSAAEIGAAVEAALSRTMLNLDQRLTAQAESIDLLKTTVAQTDSLLERVLESLDSLRQDAAPER